jgi:hypothetical protein
VPRLWLDSSVLIEAHNRTYPIGTFDSFWEWLAGEVQAGNIVCPRRVYQEIAETEYQDALAQWMKARKSKGLCIPATKSVQVRVREVTAYVFGKYEHVHAWDFSKGADPWLIAHAIDDKGIVVTKESDAHPNSKKARIPDVCDHFNVKCMDTLGMLKHLGAKNL